MAKGQNRQRELESIRRRYQRSQELYARAVRVIPLASQTFSKSVLQYPAQAAPLFLERGEGALVWDVDGNEYIDMVNALCPVILGYNDPDVNAAAAEQLGKGVIFSLAIPLETELAELLVELIPCAQMVRYGKNGSDATSAAVRVARAYTGRDRVAVCGYHGWQDWYIGSTARHKGVPAAVRELTHTFTYNDLGSLQGVLEKYPGEFAVVMLEPMSLEYPAPGFLEGVRDLTHEHGALLVFDEIVTGFRYHLGGAQALFGVTPDLAAFGKSMGNGFPISAIVGEAKYMREMEEIFYSGTFQGEALSLAASLATIRKMQREPVLATIYSRGEEVMRGVRQRIEEHGLSHCISLAGHPSVSVLRFSDTEQATQWELKSLYLQEMLARGILTHGSHNISYSHTRDHLTRLAAAQDEALAILREALEAGDIRSYLAGPPIEPLFRVR